MASYKILSKARIAVFNGVPKLTTNERKALMVQDAKTKKVIRKLQSSSNKIGFLVQRAYFQQKGRFFNPEQFRKIDIREAERSIGLTKACFNLDEYNEKTAYAHRKIIRELYNWTPYTDQTTSTLKKLAKILAKEQTDFEEALFSLHKHCWFNKIEIPSYSNLERIVISSHEEFIENKKSLLDKYITEEQKNSLLSLLDLELTGTTFSNLKKIKYGIDHNTLRENAEILELFKEIFFIALPLIEKLELSNYATKEFSTWIYHSSLTQATSLKDNNLLLLRLLSFVKDQFYLRQDHAVDAILKKLKATINKARGFDRTKRDLIEAQLLEANQTVVYSAKNAHGVIKLIGETAKNEQISIHERNEKVVNLVDSYLEATDPEFDETVARLESKLGSIAAHSNYYDYLFSAAKSLVKSLSPLVKAIEYDESSQDKQLLNAITHFKNNKKFLLVDDNSSNVPIDFLNKKDLQAFNKEDPVQIPKTTKFKVLLLSNINDALRNRTLILKYSYRFIADEQFWFTDEEWGSNRLDILTSTNLLHFADGKQVLQGIGAKLNNSYKRLNEGLNKNDFVVIDKNGEWRIKKDEADFSALEFIPKMLDEDGKSRTLYELLQEIDDISDFSSNFKHFQYKNTKSEVDKKLIYAVIMSLGTNLGHNDMSKACKSITNKHLRDTEVRRFSIKNLQKTNASIVSSIQNLSLPTIFNDAYGVLHTSSDGKKIIVAVDSLLANYSYKYYGKEQGITVNSFVDNSQSFFHVNVMTSSDREAAYMMDGIVQSKKHFFGERNDELDNDLFGNPKHSTDYHGYTDAMFSGLHLLDVSFAPRLIDLPSRALYSYDNKTLLKNSNYLIGPKTPVKKNLILEQWDNILRLMAAIKSGRQSASLIFRRLAASKKASKLYEAFKSLGQLIKSNFIANYLSNQDLRKSIQKQLNRVELGQKLSSAIFFGRKGHLTVGGEIEIHRAMLCKTILKNVIILWNYLYLSDQIFDLKRLFTHKRAF